ALSAGTLPPAQQHAAPSRSAEGRRASRPTSRSPISRPKPGPSPQPESVPADLAGDFARTRGVDVSHVPVHRGPAGAVQARALGARAYPRYGEVFLPPDVGPLAQPAARALLVHELTHIAHHSLLGDDLPEADSADGRALEADAMASERWAAGEGSALSP